MDFESKSVERLGSHFEITLLKGNEKVFDECFEELKRIEEKFSRFLDTSILSKVNSKLNEWQCIDSEFLFLVKTALEFKEKTKGNFDVTVKSALDSLGYDKNYSFKEKKQNKSLFSELKNIFASSVRIDEKNSKIYLTKEIEFGGFGKGYCLDRLSEIIESNDVFDYQINGSGDIFAKKKEGSWNILLEHPDDSNKAIGKIELNGRAIACSASNRRRWGKNHHLINAKTGLPQNSVKTIFVLAKSGIEADGYATAVFTVGFEEGIKLSKNLPIDILLISDKNKMYKSEGFDAELFN